MSSNKRAPNEHETRLHQAALKAPGQVITPQEAADIISDAKTRAGALNFLLGTGLLKAKKDDKGRLSFQAISKGELATTKDLSGEENLVYGHIRSSGNEGIWTKHIKAKTNLHQTIIDRCLKTLIQKKLIKRVPSVQYPTRKIYMLEGLEPSIALTGGPWYTDNELDTEFIQHLMDACYKFICDISFPKHAAEGALYPISNAPDYPSAQHIRNSLRKARLTETDLSVEHVEALLNVLVLDGKIEALPSYGVSLWDSAAIKDEDSDDESSRKKRKHDSDSERERKRSKRKRSKRATSSEEEDSDDARSSSKKKSKSKRNRSPASGSESDSEADVASSSKRKKRRSSKKSSRDNSDNSDESDSDADARHKAKKKKKKKRSSRSDSDSSSSDSEDDRHSRRSSKSRKSSKRSPSPFDYEAFGDFDSGGGGLVYRALKEQGPQVGWSQAPCATCPSFDFCKADGPVNPQECVYYEQWLAAKTMTTLEPGEDI